MLHFFNKQKYTMSHSAKRRKIDNKSSLFGSIHIEYNEEHKCDVFIKASDIEHIKKKRSIYRDTPTVENIFKEDMLTYIIHHYIPTCVIPKYIGFRIDQTDYLSITQYIEGSDAFDYLDQYSKIKRSLSDQQIQHIFKQLVLSIKALHDYGIVHMDISLENIMIEKTPNPKQVKVYLVDFGVAQIHHLQYNELETNKVLEQNQNYVAMTPYEYEDRELNTTLQTFHCRPIVDISKIPGKMSYVSPEVYHHKPFDAYKNDIYALGTILFYLTTQRVLYTVPELNNVYMKGTWLNCAWMQPYINKRSNHLLDLIDKMLKPEDKRISLDQVLQHPFIVQEPM